MKLFGTDGVRGHANRPPMTVETALAIGRAAGKLFRQSKGKHRVVIGKDTRLSCYMVESALIAGLCSMGVDALTVGPLPTPGVAYLTRAYRADCGIVISASHNPFYDNGIKFFSRDGYKLDDALERQIEEEVARSCFLGDLPSDGELGRNSEMGGARGRYVEFAKSSFPRSQTLSGLRIALDCAHGATYAVGPMLFEELGGDLILRGVQPNGLNINLDCGALHPGGLSRVVRAEGADVGICLDGDGDRCIMIDELGQLVDGDAILAICALDWQERGQLPGGKIVGTVMTNEGVAQSLKGRGIELIRAKVGDRHVLQEMVRTGAPLGGEQSGHTIILDYNTTGDGLIAALQVLRIMVERGVSLSKLASGIERYPQLLVNVEVARKPPIEQLKTLQEAVADANSSLSGSGRVLVRYSGTESICRVMVEGREEGLIAKLAGQLESAVREEIG